MLIQVDLVQHFDHLGAIEIAKGVGGDAQFDAVGRGFNHGGSGRDGHSAQTGDAGGPEKRTAGGSQIHTSPFYYRDPARRAALSARDISRLERCVWTLRGRLVAPAAAPRQRSRPAYAPNPTESAA